MPFAATATAITTATATVTATASYCVMNGAHVKRAHAAINTRYEVSDPVRATESIGRTKALILGTRRRAAPRETKASELKLARARARGLPERGRVRCDATDEDVRSGNERSNKTHIHGRARANVCIYMYIHICSVPRGGRETRQEESERGARRRTRRARDSCERTWAAGPKDRATAESMCVASRAETAGREPAHFMRRA